MEEKRFLSSLGLVLCGLLVLAAGVLYLGLSLAPQGTRAIVEKSGEVVLERDLSQLTEPETFTLEGEQNIQVTVELSPQGAAVVASGCPDQVCVRTGTLTKAGETAVCLPARVTLRLEGGGDSVDATVY